LIDQDTPKNPSAYDFRASGVLILECGAQGYGKDADYCCESRGEGTRCCKTSTARFRLPSATKGAFTGYATAPPSTSNSQASASEATTATAALSPSLTSTSLPTVGTDASGSKKDVRGVKIGAGIGGAIGVCLAITAFILVLQWKKKRRDTSVGIISENIKDDSKREFKAEMDTEREVVELPAGGRVHELSAKEMVHELPAKDKS